jgi:hypothetical protein
MTPSRLSFRRKTESLLPLKDKRRQWIAAALCVCARRNDKQGNASKMDCDFRNDAKSNAFFDGF